MNRETEKKVESVLGSLDHTERAAANPYLFTRVKAALDNREKTWWDSAFMLLSRPVAVAALLGIVIMINLFAFYFTPNNQSRVVNDNDDTYLSEEYAVTTTPIYEFENLEEK